ncbi:thermonuclease family protein [Alcanivorax sp. 1008]|uniref:thermonuclease family protein n=1 Tax=Alcanivorax sp. 1008 TaxID=2816853 RepID=UPI001D41D019|nr:thermonuclease family protein [Alcanivorax sp. 1008]MCC1496823.1 thermonuclease family protein [Alcanivorax sp. 1008]
MIKAIFALAPRIVLIMMAVASATASAMDMVEGDGLVYRVIDGDTYIVNVEAPSTYRTLLATAPPGAGKHFNPHYKSFKIRLANVDTPESVHVDASRNTPAGKKASAFAKELLEGKFVSFKCWTFDKYGRAICSVSKGSEDVGETLIRGGFTKYETRWGTHPYLHERYLRAAGQ